MSAIWRWLARLSWDLPPQVQPGLAVCENCRLCRGRHLSMPADMLAAHLKAHGTGRVKVTVGRQARPGKKVS